MTSAGRSLMTSSDGSDRLLAEPNPVEEFYSKASVIAGLLAVELRATTALKVSAKASSKRYPLLPKCDLCAAENYRDGLRRVDNESQSHEHSVVFQVCPRSHRYGFHETCPQTPECCWKEKYFSIMVFSLSDVPIMAAPP